MQQAVDNYLIQVLDGNVEAALPGIDAKTPVTALAYCDKRYGGIAEALGGDIRANKVR